MTTVQGDVTNMADLDRLYATVNSEEGFVDIVVANAGFIEHAKIFDLSEAHYDKTMDINVKGVVFTVQKALPLMTRGGSIVVVSSVINVKGVPAHGTYAAAKAGVRALVRVWAQELKDKGIRVNTLSPGATETPIIRGQFDSDEASDAAKSVFALMTRSAASASLKNSPRARTPWRPMNPATSPASIFRSTVAWPRSEQYRPMASRSAQAASKGPDRQPRMIKPALSSGAEDRRG